MKLRMIPSKVNDILGHLKRRRKGRLYKQWVERAGLPPEAIPQEEVTRDIIPEIDKKQLRQPILFMLLGASVVIVCAGLILLIVHAAC